MHLEIQNTNIKINKSTNIGNIKKKSIKFQIMDSQILNLEILKLKIKKIYSNISKLKSLKKLKLRNFQYKNLKLGGSEIEKLKNTNLELFFEKVLLTYETQ